MKNRQFKAVLAFALLATVLVFSWFRYGHLYGGGDVGMPSYDPQRIFDIAKYVWWDAAAPGTVVPQGLTSVPFQFFQVFLNNLGFSYVMTQAIFFWIIIFLMGYGMFLVAQTVFGQEKLKLSILAGFFYELNSYMLTSVWHRFIHNTFFLAAALPFFFLSFRSWIRGGKYLSLLLFLLANFLAVYLYGAMAFFLTIFFLLIFISGFEMLFPWKGLISSRIIAGRAIFGIIAWVCIHIWWLLPVVNISPAVLSSQHSLMNNLSTLLGMSAQIMVPYSSIGVNPYYLYGQAEFGKIFNTYFFRLLPWLSMLFLVPGFIIALKNKSYTLWALLAVAALFLAKGATAPFGYPYIFGFSSFFPIGVLRNPFEKLGIYIPFAYAILMPLGVEWYLQQKKKNLKQIFRAVVIIVLLLSMGVYLWPMWTGNIFGKIEKQAFIEVPKSYIEADRYIKNLQKTGRILHVPLTISESASYDWQYGYSGVESSQLYFNSLPSVSRGVNLGLVDDALTALSYIFLQPDSNDKALSLLQAFNCRFIILHKDMQWLGGYLPDPQKLELQLNKLKFLERKKQFGDLIIYELRDEFFNPKIKFTNNVSYLIPAEKNIFWPWLLSGHHDLLSVLGDSSKEVLIKNSKELVVSAEDTFSYKSQQVIRENLLGEIPAAKTLPDSLFYPLIRLKERIDSFRLSTQEQFSFQITLAGKRLTESYLLKQKGSLKSVIPQINEYQNMLPGLKEGVQMRVRGITGEKEISVNFILSRHLATLEYIYEKANTKEKIVIGQTIKKLANFMQETNILPYYRITDERAAQYSNLLISKFRLPMAGQYELLLAHEELQSIYPDNLSVNSFQINDEIKELTGTSKGGFISYGLINLPEGLSEISFNAVPSANLAQLSDSNKKDEMEITSGQHEHAYIEFKISPIKGDGNYQLSFDSWIQLGDKFSVRVLQDIDQYDSGEEGKKIPSYDNIFTPDSYVNYWNANVLNFYVKPMTSEVKIRLLVEPWNGCKYQHILASVCLNKALRYRYEKASKVLFKNIKVVRFFNNPIFLRSELPEVATMPSAGHLDFVQYNPVSYAGKISVRTPGFFIFNETSHPDWKLRLYNDSGGKIIPAQKFLSNLYGNAWYIENQGEYKFTLEFVPQQSVRVGIVISMAVFLVIALLSIRQRVKI